jgi:hypothetical protein
MFVTLFIQGRDEDFVGSGVVFLLLVCARKEARAIRQ